MLHLQTVQQSTLDLLIKLMHLPELRGFFLVGGTNLSLKLGHRISVDLDLFTEVSFDTEALHELLDSHFTNLTVVLKNQGALLCYIEGVKVDFVAYRYGLLNPLETIAQIRFASLADIAAMKLNALSRRGVRKDYWDIDALLEHYSIAAMLEFFKQKHQSTDIGFIVRSLVYFVDADQSENPVALNKTTWEKVKKNIQKAVKDYIDSQTR